jgi:MFS transporter, SP family, sugar:H+ symporter
MAVFILIVGALGTVPHPNTSEANMVVASMILFASFYAISWAPLSYTIMGEAAEGTVREATIQVATALSVLCTFITSFTMPYLLNAPYADLGAKVGFIYGAICVIFAVYAYFGVPEMKGTLPPPPSPHSRSC